MGITSPPLTTCPRCGTPAGDHMWCSTCGLTLRAQTNPAPFPPPPQNGQPPLAPPFPFQGSAPLPTAPPNQRTSDRGVLIGLGIAAFLVVIGLGVALYVGGVFGSGTKAVTAVKQAAKVGPTTPTTPTPPTAPSNQPALSLPPHDRARASDGPEKVITRHLDDLNAGKYEAAFRLLSASYQSANPSWPVERAAADPGITILSIGVPQFGSGGAQLPVDFYARDRNPTAGSDTQCRQFQGAVELVREFGHWRYNPAGSTVTGTAVPSNNPNCPS
jgi:hypothetical protein